MKGRKLQYGQRIVGTAVALTEFGALQAQFLETIKKEKTVCKCKLKSQLQVTTPLVYCATIYSIQRCTTWVDEDCTLFVITEL